MNSIVIVLVSVSIAALIGGVTNHLAIKMLFRPRNPVMIGGRQLWFTPGLIPKRRNEIARSLGKVVSEYLVTTEGLSSVMRKPEFRQRIEEMINTRISHLASSEETLQDCLLRYYSEEQIDSFLEQLKRWSNASVHRGMSYVWIEKGLGDKPLKELVPGWDEVKKRAITDKLAEYITVSAREELLRPEGEKLLRRLIHQFLDQAGGLFGTLAGIFMDEGKMLGKVQSVIIERLHSAVVQRALQDFLDRQLTRLEHKSLNELLSEYVHGDKEPKKQVAEWINSILVWDQWAEKVGKYPIQTLMAPIQNWLQDNVPKFVAFAINFTEGRLEQVVQAIKLPQLVEEQVERFPIERLEHIVLSVSGKEFRAITFLGALLGGMIGLLQSLFYIFYA